MRYWYEIAGHLTAHNPNAFPLCFRLAVTPETLVPEVQRLQDEMRRMQAFMGVGPGGGARPAGPGVEPMRPAALPAEMRAMEQWGAPGREPRMPGEPPRSMGEALHAASVLRCIDLLERQCAFPPFRPLTLPQSS